MAAAEYTGDIRIFHMQTGMRPRTFRFAFLVFAVSSFWGGMGGMSFADSNGRKAGVQTTVLDYNANFCCNIRAIANSHLFPVFPAFAHGPQNGPRG